MKQPEFININDTLRLKTPKKSEWDLAYPWYQNQQVMYLSRRCETSNVMSSIRFIICMNT